MGVKRAMRKSKKEESGQKEKAEEEQKEGKRARTFGSEVLVKAYTELTSTGIAGTGPRRRWMQIGGADSWRLYTNTFGPKDELARRPRRLKARPFLTKIGHQAIEHGGRRGD